MAINRTNRSIVYLLLVPAVMMPVFLSTGNPLVPVFLGMFVVAVYWWGVEQPVPVKEAAIVGAAATFAGPIFWVGLSVLIFLFVYLYTAAGMMVEGVAKENGAREVLAFLRSEFADAFAKRLLPMLSPGALLHYAIVSVSGAIGGALAGLVTRSSQAESLRRRLDYVFMWATERRQADFERRAAEHPELAKRAAELEKAGFDEDEVHRIVVAEADDPFLNPSTPRRGRTGTPPRY